MLSDPIDGEPDGQQPITDEELLREARDRVQPALMDKQRLLTKAELRAYDVTADLQCGQRMMRDLLPDDVADDDIHAVCARIGQVLMQTAQEHVNNPRYRPKRKKPKEHAPIDTSAEDVEPSSTSSQPEHKEEDISDMSILLGLTQIEAAAQADDASPSLDPPAIAAGTAASELPEQLSAAAVADLQRTVAGLTATVQQLQGSVTQLLTANATLTSAVAKLTGTNTTLASQLQTVSAPTGKCTCHTAPTPASSTLPALLIGDSTIRDVASSDSNVLDVNINGGAKTGHIKNLLQNMSKDSFGDVLVHVGTNDCSTKFPLDNIMDNMTAIVDLAKHVSATGHITLSSACPRTDKPAAAEKGRTFNEKLQQLAADTGCVYVSHADNFTCKNGDVNDELLSLDGLHLSVLGTQRLLKKLAVRLQSILQARPSQ